MLFEVYYMMRQAVPGSVLPSSSLGPPHFIVNQQWLPSSLCLYMSFYSIVVLERHQSDGESEGGYFGWMHCKKTLAIFLTPAGMSLTKLSLAENKG